MHSPPALDRLSFNQITSNRHSLQEAAEACARAGIHWIGAWRHKIEDHPEDAAKVIRDAGLKVSSLCRGGFFPSSTVVDRQKKIDDNFRAIDEAATLGADLLILVCGPAPDRDIMAARGMVKEGIAAIEKHAHDRGVRLGVEPLHPMYAAERSVVVTLEQANRIASQFSAKTVGVVIDVFQTWWDPKIYESIAESGQRIFGFHVSDWMVPMPDMLMGRAMMGEGVIEIRRLRAAVEQAGYHGPIEVEIFNDTIWNTRIDQVLEQIKASYCKFV